MNVQYSAESQQVNYLNMVDISVAVATPTGLITPIVTSADILGVQDISVRVKVSSTTIRYFSTNGMFSMEPKIVFKKLLLCGWRERHNESSCFRAATFSRVHCCLIVEIFLEFISF